MNSYKWLFHSSRYPVKPSDTAHKFDPATHNHIVVVRKNKFFVVPLADQKGNEYSASELEVYASLPLYILSIFILIRSCRQFNKIISTAGSTPSPTPIGALTSDNRDLWTDARAALVAASPSGGNAKLLEKIESAMVVLALDDTKPVTREDIGWACWVGDGKNRFYDKQQRGSLCGVLN